MIKCILKNKMMICGCGKAWNQECAIEALAQTMGQKIYTVDTTKIPRNNPEAARRYVSDPKNMVELVERTHYPLYNNGCEVFPISNIPTAPNLSPIMASLVNSENHELQKRKEKKEKEERKGRKERKGGKADKYL